MNESSIDALLTGLTGRTCKSQAGKNCNPADKEKKSTVRFCTVADKLLLRKIRYIAKRERVQIKDVVNAAFQKAIESYEKKHGVINEAQDSDVTSLF